MRRIALYSIALAVTLAVPANAKPHPAKPPKAKECKSHNVGYNARGTLVSQTLTQTAGADTAKRGDDRYSGTLTVDVKKANHRAPQGEQTYTVDNARVHGSDTAKAGDRVKIHGKITKLGKKCDATGSTPTVTVRKVDFKAAKAPKPA
jgi:hypothetical protein